MDLFGEFDNLRVIKIQAGHCVAGFRVGGFFLQADGLSVGIKLDHAVPLGVLHRVGEDGRAKLLLHGRLEGAGEVVPVKNIVTQHQRAGRAVQKFLADQKRLRQPVGRSLHGVGDADAPLAAVAQQLLKTRCVLRRGYDQNLTDPRQQQRAQGVINHGLVVNRQ